MTFCRRITCDFIISVSWSVARWAGSRAAIWLDARKNGRIALVFLALHVIGCGPPCDYQETVSPRDERSPLASGEPALSPCACCPTEADDLDLASCHISF